MPKKFFSSAVAWSLAAILLWYFGGKELGAVFGLQFPDKDADPVIGLGHFATDDFIWFYFIMFFTKRAFTCHNEFNSIIKIKETSI